MTAFWFCAVLAHKEHCWAAQSRAARSRRCVARHTRSRGQPFASAAASWRAKRTAGIIVKNSETNLHFNMSAPARDTVKVITPRPVSNALPVIPVGRPIHRPSFVSQPPFLPRGFMSVVSGFPTTLCRFDFVHVCEGIVAQYSCYD